MRVYKSNRELINELDQSLFNPAKLSNSLALLYQENSKLDKFSMMQLGENIGLFSVPYVSQRASQPYKCYPQSKSINMDDYSGKKQTAGSLFDILSKRRSVRKFADYELSMGELYSILHYAYGVTSEQEMEGGAYSWALRTVPSAGALYPLELYLFVNRAAIQNGLYHYRVDTESLELVDKHLSLDLFRDCVVTEPYIQMSDSCCLLFITSVAERVLLKYGERGYRFMIQEVGATTQNVSLVCYELGLGSCIVGGFLDDKLNNLLDVDGTLETIQSVVVIGKAS